MKREFVFFRRCHQCVSGAPVVVMLETASIKGPVIIYEEEGRREEKYVGKIKILVRPPLKTM